MVKPFGIIGAGRREPLENRRVVRQCYFFRSLFPPMDCFGTSKEKHYSDRFLGMQRARKRFGLKLLCHLSARFGGGADDSRAAAFVHSKSVLEMARGIDRKEGSKTRCSARQVADRYPVGGSL